MSKNEIKLSLEEATELVNQWIKITNAKDDNSDAEIEIDGTIGYDYWTGDNSNTAKAIKNKLKEIANMKAKRINVRINSLGGYVDDGLAIHDALAVNKAEIVTDVQGVAASMATVIAQAGTTRKMSDNALYLIHQVSGLSWGNINDTQAALDDLIKWNDRLVNIYVKRTGKKEKEIRKLMDKNNGYGIWIDADDALEMGFIDEVYEPMKAAAFAGDEGPDMDKLKNLKLPEIPEEKIEIFKNHSDMSKEKTGDQADKPVTKTVLQAMYEDLIEKARNIFGKKEEDSEEVTLPEEVQKDMDEIKNLVDNFQDEQDEEKEALKKERDEFEAEAKKLRGLLTQQNAASTKTKGPAGEEDADDGPKLSQEEKDLQDSAANIRKYATTVID